MEDLISLILSAIYDSALGEELAVEPEDVFSKDFKGFFEKCSNCTQIAANQLQKLDWIFEQCKETYADFTKLLTSLKTSCDYGYESHECLHIKKFQAAIMMSVYEPRCGPLTVKPRDDSIYPAGEQIKVCKGAAGLINTYLMELKGLLSHCPRFYEVDKFIESII
ncbi:hypothetical protein CSKR_109880 [Clonorchis sinensis]|uniref:Uncharacterized protein n=1 Tax=Clonorchis sinensis TaxID=79923 RepID=A0A8T1LZC9_CLOSI|nr:hypothetical protein CSKR_109880 [Clonorchis sinensis]